MHTHLFQAHSPTPIQKAVLLARNFSVEFNIRLADLIDRQDMSISQLERVTGTIGMRDLLNGQRPWSEDLLDRAMDTLQLTVRDAVEFQRGTNKELPQRRRCHLQTPRRPYVQDWPTVKQTLQQQPYFDQALRVMNAKTCIHDTVTTKRQRIGALLTPWLEDRLIWPQEIANAMLHYGEIKFRSQFAQLRLYGTGTWTAGRIAVVLWRTGWTADMLVKMANGLTIDQATAP